MESLTSAEVVAASRRGWTLSQQRTTNGMTMPSLKMFIGLKMAENRFRKLSRKRIRSGRRWDLWCFLAQRRNQRNPKKSKNVSWNLNGSWRRREGVQNWGHTWSKKNPLIWCCCKSLEKDWAWSILGHHVTLFFVFFVLLVTALRSNQQPVHQSLTFIVLPCWVFSPTNGGSMSRLGLASSEEKNAKNPRYPRKTNHINRLNASPVEQNQPLHWLLMWADGPVEERRGNLSQSFS